MSTDEQGAVRIDHGVSAGTFSLDGQTHQVENNIWVIGDDAECYVIDAPHTVEDILAVVGDRSVKAIVCTHAHDDHVRVAPELAKATGAPILLHPDDAPLWEMVHTEVVPDRDLADGDVLPIGDAAIEVIHTPGHAPGAVCLHWGEGKVLFSGDTLFAGGPGATGRSFSDHDIIVDSIRTKLFALPDETTVHTGHGDSTTIGAEATELGR